MSIQQRSLLLLAALVVAILPAVVHAGGSPGAGATPTPPVTSGWRVVLTTPHVRKPTGLAIDTRGPASKPKWAYTADAATGRIVKFGTGGKYLQSWPYTTSTGSPAAVAVGGSGNVFVADPAAGTVTKFSPFGKLLARWTGFVTPVGVAVNSAGHIFVAERDAHQVTELSPSGAILARWSPAAIYSPGGQSNLTGVAIGPPGQVYMSTQCISGTTCGIGIDSPPAGMLLDGLLEFWTSGPVRGHMMEIWYGSKHIPGGPSQPPDKESEPFTAINAITNDRQGWLYVAGTIWWRGGNPAQGVLAYTPIGYKWDTLYLPSQTPPSGVAVDPGGTVYVSQGSRILAHRLGKRPSSPTG